MSRKASADRGLIRQGDVLLVPCDEFEQLGLSGLAPTVAESHVLAEGEATGHAHRLRSTSPTAFHRTSGGREFVVVPAGADASLVHQEHDALQVAKGTWEVRRQREYEPSKSASRRWRAVKD